MTGRDMMLDRPIFIVGNGRSGTTLLRAVLSAHSRIAVTPETHFMKRAGKAGPLGGAPADFDAFWRDLVAWPRFRDLGVDPARCLKIIEACGRRDFETIFAVLLKVYADLFDKPRVGEKTPGHVRYLARLFTWFPDARVVFAIRDPRAFVASQLLSPWVVEAITPRSLRAGLFEDKREQAILEHAGSWAKVNGEDLPRWRDDRRVLPVRYEDLVQRPESLVRTICDFVEVPYEPGMLSEKSEASVPDPAGDHSGRSWADWRSAHNAQSRGAVTTAGLEKWRAQLSPAEVAMIESLCGATMTREGYAVESSAVARRIWGVAGPVLRAGARAEMSSRRAWRALRGSVGPARR